MVLADGSLKVVNIADLFDGSATLSTPHKNANKKKLKGADSVAGGPRHFTKLVT